MKMDLSVANNYDVWLKSLSRDRMNPSFCWGYNEGSTIYCVYASSQAHLVDYWMEQNAARDESLVWFNKGSSYVFLIPLFQQVKGWREAKYQLHPLQTWRSFPSTTGFRDEVGAHFRRWVTLPYLSKYFEGHANCPHSRSIWILLNPDGLFSLLWLMVLNK